MSAWKIEAKRELGFQVLLILIKIWADWSSSRAHDSRWEYMSVQARTESESFNFRQHSLSLNPGFTAKLTELQTGTSEPYCVTNKEKCYTSLEKTPFTLL